MPTLLLLHSPLVGPSTWLPAARAFADRGLRALIPDLRAALEGPRPYWRVWAALAAASASLDDEVVLVGHSGAGRFLPLVADAIGRPPTAYVFVDAGLPHDGESSMTRASQDFRDLIRVQTEADSRLTPWTSWWGDDVMAALVPDPGQRALIVADCPRVPAALLEEPLPVPAQWPNAPCAYVSFTYADDAAEAAALGWPVTHLAGRHLHAVVDPVGVADAIVGLLVAAGVLTQ